MTLLEVIVGLAITGLAVTAGYSGLASILDNRARAEQAMDATLQAANERKLLRVWLAGAHLTVEDGGPAFTGLDRVQEQIPDDGLTFLTSATTALGNGETVVSLRIDRDPTTPERGLVATLRGWPGTSRRTFQVDPRVRGLDIRYFSVPLGDRGWLPSWISSTLLPSGIELSLVGDSLPDLLRVPMLVPVEASR
jgi:type II secretory pathway pseudopilin PulG